MAETLGVPTASILSWARSGLLSPRRDARGYFVFSFRDIALLRKARELVEADVSPRRVRRALESLREQLPAGRPLSAVQLDALGGQVLVRDGGRSWEPDTGQLHLTLEDGASPASVATDLDTAPKTSRTARTHSFIPRDHRHSVTAPAASAGDRYDQALALEADDPGRAKELYREALELDPDHAEAHLNLGRLLHEDGDLPAAEAHYRAAADADATNGRCFYNLGVVLEDQDRPSQAIEAYQAALALDADLAVAHFNISRLFETQGRSADALRHLASYKRLLGRGVSGG